MTQEGDALQTGGACITARIWYCELVASPPPRIFEWNFPYLGCDRSRTYHRVETDPMFHYDKSKRWDKSLTLFGCICLLVVVMMMEFVEHYVWCVFISGLLSYG